MYMYTHYTSHHESVSIDVNYVWQAIDVGTYHFRILIDGNLRCIYKYALYVLSSLGKPDRNTATTSTSYGKLGKLLVMELRKTEFDPDEGQGKKLALMCPLIRTLDCLRQEKW